MSVADRGVRSAVSARASAIAFAWGFAEALIFFIVPDVFLTRVALHDLRRALIACGWALVGALIGGIALWAAANHGHAPVLLHAFRWLPGINNDVIAAAGQAVQREGATAMLVGAIAGRPYKLYAVHAGAQNVSFLAFFGVSLVARLGRFVATTLLAWLIGRVLAQKPEGFRLRLHTLFWMGFYALYFAVMW